MFGIDEDNFLETFYYFSTKSLPKGKKKRIALQPKDCCLSRGCVFAFVHLEGRWEGTFLKLWAIQVPFPWLSLLPPYSL